MQEPTTEQGSFHLGNTQGATTESRPRFHRNDCSKMQLHGSTIGLHGSRTRLLRNLQPWGNCIAVGTNRSVFGTSVPYQTEEKVTQLHIGSNEWRLQDQHEWPQCQDPNKLNYCNSISLILYNRQIIFNSTTTAKSFSISFTIPGTLPGYRPQ